MNHDQSSYQKGCKCRICKQAHRDYQAQWLQKIRSEPIPAHVIHGASCYRNYSCRCDVCTKGNRISLQNWRKRVSGSPPDHAHGLNGYTNYRCRCDVCKQAHSSHRQSKATEP